MKKLLILFLAFLTITSYAQTFSVESIDKLALSGSYSGVKIDNLGENLLLSSSEQNALILFNMARNEQTKLSENGGDIRSSVFSNDNTTVYFAQSYKINNRIYKDLYSYDMNHKTQRVLEEKIRFLSVPKVYQSYLLYTNNSSLQRVSADKSRIKNDQPGNEKYVTIEDQQIVLYVNGERSVIKPFESGSYIWPSLSPDENSILFYEVRKGAFIYDLTTFSLLPLGDLQALSWIDDTWIVGMETDDDGERLCYGAIVVMDSNGNNKQYISQEKEISLYPVVARKGNKISYLNDNGEIFIVNYTIK